MTNKQAVIAFLTRIGRKGGKASSKAKRNASRRNGKLGGRPRKAVEAQ